MTIQEIKAAITKGLVVACGNSKHLVVLDSLELWGLAVFNTVSRTSGELTRLAMDDCFILEGV